MPRADPSGALSEPRLSSDALLRGASRYSLATDRVDHPVHGVVAAQGTLGEMAARCRAIAMTLPKSSAFSHATAALLQQLPLPLSLDRSGLHVSVPAGSVVPDHRSLTCHGQWLPDEHIDEVGGVRCVVTARCFLDLAALMPHEHLVALGDHILHHQQATLEDLTSIVAGAARRRGVVTARRALLHLDARAESPPESITRVWLTEAELPGLVPQYTICDDNRDFVARVDLAIPEFQIVIEYQGSYHREAAMFAADIERRRRLRALGYLVVEIEAMQLRSEWLVVHAVIEALRERGWTGQPHPSYR